MMLTGLQTSSKTLPLDGTLGKSQSVDSETVQPVSFGEVLKLKEKQLQQEQEVNPASIAAALAALQTMSLATPLPLPQIETVETNETTSTKTALTQSAVDVAPQASSPSTGISDAVASTPLTAARLTPTESADSVSSTFSNAVSESLAQPATSPTELPQPQLFQVESSKSQASQVVTSTQVDNTALTNQNFATTASYLTSTIKQTSPSTIPSTSNDVTAYSVAQAKPTQLFQVESARPQALTETTSTKVDSFVNQNITANVMKANPTIKQDLPSATPNASEKIATPEVSQTITSLQTKFDTTVTDKHQVSTPEVQTAPQQVKSSVPAFATQGKRTEIPVQNNTTQPPMADEFMEASNDVLSPVSLTNETNAPLTQDSQAQVQTLEFTTQPIAPSKVDADLQPLAETLAPPSFTQPTNKPQSEVVHSATSTLSPHTITEEAFSTSESIVANTPLRQETPSASQPQVAMKTVELREKSVEIPVTEDSELATNKVSVSRAKNFDETTQHEPSVLRNNGATIYKDAQQAESVKLRSLGQNDQQIENSKPQDEVWVPVVSQTTSKSNPISDELADQPIAVASVTVKQVVNDAHNVSEIAHTETDLLLGESATLKASFEINAARTNAHAVEPQTNFAHEANSSAAETVESKFIKGITCDESVFANESPSVTTPQAVMVSNNHESETSLTNELGSQATNTIKSANDFSGVTKESSTIEQPLGTEIKSQKLEEHNEVTTNGPVQTVAQPAAQKVNRQPVVETQPPVEQSNTTSAVEVANIAKAEANVKQAATAQIEQQVPKVNQGNTVVETHQVAEALDQASSPVPTIFSAETESVTQEQTQVTTPQIEQQSPQAETKTTIAIEENISSTELTQPDVVSQPTSNNSFVKSETLELTTNSLQNKKIESDQPLSMETEQVDSAVDISTNGNKTVSSEDEKTVSPLDVTTQKSDSSESSAKVSKAEQEWSQITNKAQTKIVEPAPISETVVESSSQTKNESVTVSQKIVTETKSNAQPIKVEAKVNLEKPEAVKQVESGQINNQAEIKVDGVKVSVVEPKEKLNTVFYSAMDKPEAVVTETAGPTPSGNDVVTPIASKPNISSAKDTIKVKQVGKDEDTTPTEKQPKLNQMSGSVVAATSPNKEAVAIDRSGNLPSTPVNAQAVEVAQQVIRHFSSNLKTGANTMHLQLNPKELGAIDIQMVSNAQGVHVSFVTEQADTSKLLEMQLPQLRESLTAAGVQLSGLDISQHNQSGQKGGGFRQEPNAAPWPNEIFLEESQSVSEASAAERRFGQASEVDYRV